MKIAYVDHSYHEKTLSTRFIPDYLVSKGHQVDLFWDNHWKGGAPVLIDQVKKYDAVIMFQSHCAIDDDDYFLNHHPNIIYIPMLDQFGVWRGPIDDMTRFWRKFQGCKVVNFSTASHGLTVGMGIRSELFRFYREPSVRRPSIPGLHGFLWVRLEDEVSWTLVKKLIGDTKFDSFHLHVATDPVSKKVVLPTSEDIEKYGITITNWFDDKADFYEVLDKANVYFAPRMEEGIGQSFLEAIARGQCVVAANNGTMNEYIQSGFNGLLYDWQSPAPLDFSEVAAISDRAYESGVAGYKAWITSLPSLERYICMSREEAYLGRYNVKIPANNVVPSDGSGSPVLKPTFTVRIRKKLAEYYYIRVIYNYIHKKIVLRKIK